MAKYHFNDNFYTIDELSEMSGILPHTIRDRLRRGYPVEEAVKVTATNESVKEFSAASLWEDWIGMSISDLYDIYWKWAMSHGYSPTSKQGFSRHLMQMYPMLKTVPTKSGDKYARIIRMR